MTEPHPASLPQSKIYFAIGITAFLIIAALVLTPGISTRLILLGALPALGYIAYMITALIHETQVLSYHLKTSEAAREEYVRNTQRTINDEKIIVINKFSSIVSHELKNPLASLKNIAFYLTRAGKFEDERSKKMLDMISPEIDRTNQIVNELLDLSRVKKIDKSPSKINEIIETAISEASLAESMHITCNLTPVEAIVDPDRFKQIVTNLLTNARDAMPKGGEITITLAAHEDIAELIFQDTGTGMDKDTLDHIFDPLFTTKTKVLGFGLTLVKQIVAMHNGTIEAKSEIGRGTTFRIYLPLH